MRFQYQDIWIKIYLQNMDGYCQDTKNYMKHTKNILYIHDYLKTNEIKIKTKFPENKS